MNGRWLPKKLAGRGRNRHNALQLVYFPVTIFDVLNYCTFGQGDFVTQKP